MLKAHQVTIRVPTWALLYIGIGTFVVLPLGILFAGVVSAASFSQREMGLGIVFLFVGILFLVTVVLVATNFSDMQRFWLQIDQDGIKGNNLKQLLPWSAVQSVSIAHHPRGIVMLSLDVKELSEYKLHPNRWIKEQTLIVATHMMRPKPKEVLAFIRTLHPELIK
jgi:hypothetical protein